MSSRWVPIRYRDFYDFPRGFVVERSGDLPFFDCPFNDVLDDYEADFTVFRLKDELRGNVDQASWTNLGRDGERLGVVPTRAVLFDETTRHAIDAGIFEMIR